MIPVLRPSSLLSDLGHGLFKLSCFLHRLQCGNYYGSVTLKMEAGRVVSIQTQQTIKPEELEDVRLVK